MIIHPSNVFYIFPFPALFTFNPPLKVEARTHLQLGQLYATYTQNHDLSLSHTEKAWLLSENINAFDDVKFDAANLLAKLYQNQNQTIKAKTVLRKAIEYSQHNIYWYSKFLFQIAVSRNSVLCCIRIIHDSYLILANSCFRQGIFISIRFTIHRSRFF